MHKNCPPPNHNTSTTHKILKKNKKNSIKNSKRRTKLQNFNGTHKFEKEKQNFNEKSKTTCTIEKTCRHMILAKNLQIIKHYKTLLLLAMKDQTDLEPCRKKNHRWTLSENKTSPSTMNHKKMKTLWAHLLETSSNNPHKMKNFKSPKFQLHNFMCQNFTSELVYKFCHGHNNSTPNSYDLKVGAETNFTPPK